VIAVITEVLGADLPMVGGRMVFCEIAGLVIGAGFPVDEELALPYPVLDPIKVHISTALDHH
jgi:hypothetical protein